MNKVFITADWHLFHKPICKGSFSRPDSSFACRDFPSLNDMHNAIIDNINSMVDVGDTLWNLGDVIFANYEQLPALMSRINCRDIRLVLGNHDKNIKPWRLNDAGYWVPRDRLGACFSMVCSRKRIRHGSHRIELIHEPLHTWAGINHGFMNLHGHCHANLPDRNLRQKDIGIDTNDLKPYLLDDVIEELLKRDYVDCPDIPQDHHSKPKHS